MRLHVWVLPLACCVLAAAGDRVQKAPKPRKVISAYVFVGEKVLDPARISAEKLTHINYAFANIRDRVMVEGFGHDGENFRLLNGLKGRNPQLKVLVAVGGWTWSGNFSDVALTRQSRKPFIESVVAFLERHKLDGLDVDWEFPGQKGLNNVHRPEDKQNCTALMAELRSALDRAGKTSGKRYLLTMATQAAEEWLAHTEMGKVQKHLDFVNLMAYDQYVDSDPIAGHHAPLFTNPANPKKLSAAAMVDRYIAAGVPARKIVLGVPFYGRAWGEVPAVANGLYQPGKRPASRLPGSFHALKEDFENKNGFVRYWDDVSKAPFLYNADRRIFVSYDDEESVGIKARFVVERGLAGLMFWRYNEDGVDPLLDAMRQGLQ